jgi:hypothetical protein
MKLGIEIAVGSLWCTKWQVGPVVAKVRFTDRVDIVTNCNVTLETTQKVMAGCQGYVTSRDLQIPFCVEVLIPCCRL